MANYHVQTLANSIIGTAILAMPYCFSKCGVILSILLLLISTIITRSCCHYLIKASIVTRRRNMEQLGFHMFGSAGKTMVEISVIGFLMGTCIAFYVVIGDLSPLIVSKIFNIQSYSHDSVRKFLIIAITLVCIIPLCFQKSIESLSFVCRASIGFYVCLTLKTVFESFERFENDKNWASNIDLWKPEGVLQCIPIFSMAMSCQMQLFEVYETMGFPGSFDRIKKTVGSATLICCVVYCTVGFFGYLAFYNQTLSGNVLMNFRPSLANDAITIGFILSIACSFPLVIFPCRAALASFLHRKSFHSEIASYVPESKYQPLTLFIIFTTMVLGILVPSVEVIISLVGSTIGVLVCYVFPASCFVKIMQRSSAEKTFAQFIIVAGFVIMILGTYANLNAIDTAKSGSHIQEKLPNVESLIEHPKDTHNVQQIKPGTPEVLPTLVVKMPEDEAKQKEPEVKKVGPEPEVKKQPEVKISEPKLKPNEPEGKISDDAIKKEEQEIAADKAAAKDAKEELKEKDEEIQVLKESKSQLEKEVHEMKEELTKQNKETQQLVMQKFDEIAEKVDKIERQSLDSGPSGKDQDRVVDGEQMQSLDEVLKEQQQEKSNKVVQAPVVFSLTNHTGLRSDVHQGAAKAPDAIKASQLTVDEKLKEPSKNAEEAPQAPINEPEVVVGSLKVESKADDPPKSDHKLDETLKTAPKLEAPAKPDAPAELAKPEEPSKPETRVDPIVKLIKSQEPLSYQIGEKMMESKKSNSSLDLVKHPEPKPESSEIKNEMRRKRDTELDDVLSSLDKTLENFEIKSMISRDLKSLSDEAEN